MDIIFLHSIYIPFYNVDYYCVGNRTKVSNCFISEFVCFLVGNMSFCRGKAKTTFNKLIENELSKQIHYSCIMTSI